MTVVGILLTILGSLMSRIIVEATQQTAAQLDDIRVLALLPWRDDGPGRVTGLLLLLVGLVPAGAPVGGIVLTGVILALTGEFEGVFVDLGAGNPVKLLGTLLLLSGGILQLAAGPASAADEVAVSE